MAIAVLDISEVQRSSFEAVGGRQVLNVPILKPLLNTDLYKNFDIGQ